MKVTSKQIVRNDSSESHADVGDYAICFSRLRRTTCISLTRSTDGYTLRSASFSGTRTTRTAASGLSCAMFAPTIGAAMGVSSLSCATGNDRRGVCEDCTTGEAASLVDLFRATVHKSKIAAKNTTTFNGSLVME